MCLTLTIEQLLFDPTKTNFLGVTSGKKINDFLVAMSGVEAEPCSSNVV